MNKIKLRIILPLLFLLVILTPLRAQTTSINPNINLNIFTNQEIYEIEDRLILSYILTYAGQSLNFDLNLIVRMPDGTLFDLTDYLTEQANINHGCVDNPSQENCPISYENIHLPSTANWQGDIFDYTLRDDIPGGNYSLIVTLIDSSNREIIATDETTFFFDNFPRVDLRLRINKNNYFTGDVLNLYADLINNNGLLENINSVIKLVPPGNRNYYLYFEEGTGTDFSEHLRYYSPVNFDLRDSLNDRLIFSRTWQGNEPSGSYSFNGYVVDNNGVKISNTAHATFEFNRNNLCLNTLLFRDNSRNTIVNSATGNIFSGYNLISNQNIFTITPAQAAANTQVTFRVTYPVSNEIYAVFAPVYYNVNNNLGLNCNFMLQNVNNPNENPALFNGFFGKAQGQSMNLAFTRNINLPPGLYHFYVLNYRYSQTDNTWVEPTLLEARLEVT